MKGRGRIREEKLATEAETEMELESVRPFK